MTRNPVYKFLTTAAGVKDASVDGSSTPVDFNYVPAGNRKVFIHRILVHYGDTANWSADNFGDFAAPLTNGIQIQLKKRVDDSVSLDLCDGLPIKANSEWSRFAFDMDLDSFGSGNDFLKARWTFAKSGIPLYIPEDEYFSVTINDDLTGLTEFTFMINGFYIEAAL